MRPEPVTTITPVINQTVLVSGADYFSVKELNPYSHATDQPNVEITTREHAAIITALHSAGVDVRQVPAPPACQDGVYTANWALVLGSTAVLSNLPGPRRGEEPAAEATLQSLGLHTIRPPYRFSGQGDCLAVGPYLLCGQGYRTDPRMHPWLAKTFPERQVISLQTIPALGPDSRPVINRETTWPDSLFYDIDLALAVLTPTLIAWCPEAFDATSQATIRDLDLERIEVSYDEAVTAFACNLISTGHTVIMSDRAPQLQAAIEAQGLRTITPAITQLAKGGGYIRCTTLTLSN